MWKGAAFASGASAPVRLRAAKAARIRVFIGEPPTSAGRRVRLFVEPECVLADPRITARFGICFMRRAVKSGPPERLPYRQRLSGCIIPARSPGLGRGTEAPIRSWFAVLLRMAARAVACLLALQRRKPGDGVEFLGGDPGHGGGPHAWVRVLFRRIYFWCLDRGGARRGWRGLRTGTSGFTRSISRNAIRRPVRARGLSGDALAPDRGYRARRPAGR